MDVNYLLSPENVMIFGTLAMLMLTAAIVAFILLYQRKLSQRKMEFDRIQQEFKKQELATAYAMLQAQDEERQRIAEDLHDNLGSTLSALTMFSSTIVNASSPNKDHLNRLNQLAQKAHLEVRQISHQLDASKIKHFGLEAAIKELSNTINSTGKIAVSFKMEMQEQVDFQLGQQLYRITQELLTNTLKYARATQVDISIIETNEDKMIYQYRDNGVGMHSSTPNSNGMGLRNITSRLEKLEAQIYQTPPSTPGYSFAFEVPISNGKL